MKSFFYSKFFSAGSRFSLGHVYQGVSGLYGLILIKLTIASTSVNEYSFFNLAQNSILATAAASIGITQLILKTDISIEFLKKIFIYYICFLLLISFISPFYTKFISFDNFFVGVSSIVLYSISINLIFKLKIIRLSIFSECIRLIILLSGFSWGSLTNTLTHQLILKFYLLSHLIPSFFIILKIFSFNLPTNSSIVAASDLKYILNISILNWVFSISGIIDRYILSYFYPSFDISNYILFQDITTKFTNILYFPVLLSGHLKIIENKAYYDKVMFNVNPLRTKKTIFLYFLIVIFFCYVFVLSHKLFFDNLFIITIVYLAAYCKFYSLLQQKKIEFYDNILKLVAAQVIVACIVSVITYLCIPWVPDVQIFLSLNFLFMNLAYILILKYFLV